MDEAFKSAEIRVAAYNDLTAEQGRALYAAYVKRGLAIENLSAALRQIYPTSRAKHQELIVGVLSKYGNPGSPVRAETEGASAND